jgi:hypothetical protein
MTHAHASWRLKPDTPTSAVRFSTHGHTRKSSRSSSARGCRLCLRSMTATRLASSHRLRPSVIKRPDEEPCLLRILLRPISRPSLSRSSCSSVWPRNRCRRERAQDNPEHAGYCPSCNMGRGPEAKVPQAIPAREGPSFECRGHPVSSPEGCPEGGSLRPVHGRLGGRRCLRKDLDLERSRLREENALADGQGAWNPS